MRPPPSARLRAAALLTLLALAEPACGFDLQAHRGGRGLAPENTLPAFARALDLGVDTLELDIGVTADGMVVIAHDPWLNPSFTRDASGDWLPESRGPLLKDLTLAQLGTYDVGRLRPGTSYAQAFATQEPRDGTRIPALAQLFALVAARGATVRFNIETKIHPEHTVGAEAMTRALLKVIAGAGMTARVSIQSFDWRTLQLVQQLAPAMPTVYLTTEGAGSNNNVRDGNAGFTLAAHGSVPRMVKAAGGAAWSPNFAALTPERLKEVRDLGLKVIPWTVNEPADMDRLLAMGVDGIITDYPDRLRQAMARRGLPLPPAARP